MLTRATIFVLATAVIATAAPSFASDASDDVKSCTEVIDNMLEASWSEPPAELAKALGVSDDFVRGCVAAYRSGKTPAAAPAAKPTCADVVAALEGAGAEKSPEEVAATLHTTVDHVRECAQKSGD